MKTLILGSSGQIGNSILKIFNSDKNYDIYIHKRQNLDLEDYENTFNSIKKFHPQLIINAAGSNGGIEKNIRDGHKLVDTNMRIALNVIRTAEELRIPRLISFAPSCGYPSNMNVKITEDKFGNEPLEKSSELYALAKILEFKLMSKISKNNMFNWQTLILSNVYGVLPAKKGDDAHVIESLWRKIIDPEIPKVQIWGSGKAIRNFIHKDDVAAAVFFIVNEEINEPIINIAAEDDCSIEDLFFAMKAVLQSTKEYFFDVSKPQGAKFKSMNSDLLRQYGWTAKISLLEGLRKMKADQ